MARAFTFILDGITPEPLSRRAHVKQRSPHVTPTQRRPEAIRWNPSGAHYGGSCLGCGMSVGFWFNTKLCDRCLSRPARVDSPGGWNA